MKPTADNGSAAYAMIEVQYASKAPHIPDEVRLRHWAGAAFMDQPDTAELVIRIVDAAESRDLNRRYRQQDKPTNVLSFPFETPEHIPLDLLGDLIICAPIVAQEACEQGKTPHAHWAHMLVHGTLHLQGFDHIDAADAQLMETTEIEILQSLGFPNPYDATSEV